MKKTATASQYLEAFSNERENVYPAIDSIEEQLGYAMDKTVLNNIARVLACPVKVNPPNWQHGRLLYAHARSYLANTQRVEAPVFVDIGTAKGFSAVVMALAMLDSGCTTGKVHSVDVIDPLHAVVRNSIAEVANGPLPLQKYLDLCVEKAVCDYISFTGGGSQELAKALAGMHVGFAFIDGKHSKVAVASEIAWLSSMQTIGDVVIFDDAQVPEVFAGIKETPRNYEVAYVKLNELRSYAIARRVS